MARRRLIAVVLAFALIAAWVGWWQSGNGLSAAEKRLLGTWRLSSSHPGRDGVMVRFMPDRRCEFWIDLHEAVSKHGAYWRMTGGLLTIDREGSAVRRTLRTVGRFVRVRSAPATQHQIEMTADGWTMDKGGQEQTATLVASE
jgi:hypothetical protein